jgi:transcriptional regulator with XRE-family HTH domain
VSEHGQELAAGEAGWGGAGMEHRRPGRRSVKSLDREDAVLVEDLARTIRQARWGRGVTIEMLARRMGVSLQQVQKYEQGKNMLSVVRLVQIARALEVSPRDLLLAANAGSAEEAETARQAIGIRESRPHRGETALVAAFRKLSVGQQRDAMAMLIESMLSSDEAGGLAVHVEAGESEALAA